MSNPNSLNQSNYNSNSSLFDEEDEDLDIEYFDDEPMRKPKGKKIKKMRKPHER